MFHLPLRMQCRRMFSERALSMCGRQVGFLKQRKVGARKKFLPKGWSIGKGKERGGRKIVNFPRI